MRNTALSWASLFPAEQTVFCDLDIQLSIPTSSIPRLVERAARPAALPGRAFWKNDPARHQTRPPRPNRREPNTRRLLLNPERARRALPQFPALRIDFQLPAKTGAPAPFFRIAAACASSRSPRKGRFHEERAANTPLPQ